MNRHTFSLMLLLFSFLMLPVFSFGAQAEIEPVESLLSAVIQESYPDCQLFDYAPIGQEKTEYIALALDSEEKPAVMIVNTEQPAAGVEFHNEKILKEIPLDKGTVQVMDHMLNGYPYIEYRAADGPEFLYVVFEKDEGCRWKVNEVQFGDEWHSGNCFLCCLCGHLCLECSWRYYFDIHRKQCCCFQRSICTHGDSDGRWWSSDDCYELLGLPEL